MYKGDWLSFMPRQRQQQMVADFDEPLSELEGAGLMILILFVLLLLLLLL